MREKQLCSCAPGSWAAVTPWPWGWHGLQASRSSVFTLLTVSVLTGHRAMPPTAACAAQAWAWPRPFSSRGRWDRGKNTTLGPWGCVRSHLRGRLAGPLARSRLSGPQFPHLPYDRVDGFPNVFQQFLQMSPRVRARRGDGSVRGWGRGLLLWLPPPQQPPLRSLSASQCTREATV